MKTTLIKHISKVSAIKAKAILPLLILLSLANVSLAQKKSVAKVQNPVEWPHYERTWFKKAKSNLKDALSDTRKSNKRKKRGNKNADKLSRMRDKVTELSAKKED